MARRMRTQINIVQKTIAEQELAAASSPEYYGRSMATVGYVGGYRQALTDVLSALDGFTDSNSRFQSLWDSVIEGSNQ